MASRQRMEIKCQRKNQEGRLVEIVDGKLLLQNYWKAAAQYSFLINICDDNLRNNALVQAICSISRKHLCPTIVLNRSSLLEQSLIQCANKKQMGRLYSVSPIYKRYDLFCGLEEQQILQVLNRQASGDSYANMAAFEQYAAAFLHIIQLKYKISYNAMVGLAELSDQEIVTFAENYHACPKDRNVFVNDTVTGYYFRAVLQKLGSTFSQIMSTDNTYVSLANITNDASVYLMWSFSVNTSCFNSVIAQELMALVKKGIRFNLLLNDVNFMTDDPLLLFIRQHSPSIGLLGICTSDAAMVVNHSGDFFDNDLCSSMGARLLIRTQGDSLTHFETVLKSFGTYTHYEVQEAFQRPQNIFPNPFHDTNSYNIVTSEQPRISLKDVEQFPVVAYGHNGGKVTLYSGIRY